MLILGVLCMPNVKGVSAATVTNPEWSGTGAVRNKVFLEMKEIKPIGYRMSGVDYFAVKDIAKLLKDSKKKFNFKFDLSKNTLTFYPGKAYSLTDTSVIVKKNKVELQWTSSTASNRGTKIYVGGKKVSVTVYIYKGTFYMQLQDIAQIIKCGIFVDDDKYKVNLSTKQDYNGVEEFKAGLSKNTTKVVIGEPSPVKTNDNTEIIKQIFPKSEVKLVKNPKTIADFEKLYKYMFVNNIMSCSVETNVPYEDIYDNGGIFDIADEGSRCIGVLNHGVIGGVSIDVVKAGQYGKLAIEFNKSIEIKEKTSKEVLKLKKEYDAKIIAALQDLIDDGKLKANMTEKQKAEVLIKWVADNVTGVSFVGEVTFYKAVMEGEANCNGYTSLYNLLCRHVGIYNMEYISGKDKTTGIGHAWTAQVLDGKKVMTDATWFDFEYDPSEDFYGDEYFAQPIKNFKKDHYWLEDAYPEWK